MNDVEQQIEAHIQKFARELNELVRTAAVRAVTDVLGTPVAVSPTRAQKAPVAPAKPAAPTRRRSNKKSQGWRRSPAQLERVQEDLEAYVTANPGELMENIAKALDSKSPVLHRPMSKLIDSGRVRREGEKRATRYYPGDGRASSKAASQKRAAASKGGSRTSASKRRAKKR